LLKTNKYRISNKPRVLTIKSIINYHFSPLLADFHKAKPFQNRDQPKRSQIRRELEAKSALRLEY